MPEGPNLDLLKGQNGRERATSLWKWSELLQQYVPFERTQWGKIPGSPPLPANNKGAQEEAGSAVQVVAN